MGVVCLFEKGPSTPSFCSPILKEFEANSDISLALELNTLSPRAESPNNYCLPHHPSWDALFFSQRYFLDFNLWCSILLILSWMYSGITSSARRTYRPQSVESNANYMVIISPIYSADEGVCDRKTFSRNRISKSLAVAFFPEQRVAAYRAVHSIHGVTIPSFKTI